MGSRVGRWLAPIMALLMTAGCVAEVSRDSSPTTSPLAGSTTEVEETSTTVDEVETTTTAAPATAPPTAPPTTAAPPTTVPQSRIDFVLAGDRVSNDDFRAHNWHPGRELIVPEHTIEQGQVHFMTPSRNISCSMENYGKTTCALQERADPPSGWCEEGPAWLPEIIGASASETFDGTCAGDMVVPFASNVLPYGSTLVNAGFGCRSEEDGLTCVHLETGRGFFARRAGVDFY